MLFTRKNANCITAMLIILTALVSANFAQGLLREYWSGISGNYVSDLTSNPAYPDNPTSRNTITIFEGPTNTADNYGTRIRGYVVPPTTGNYTFWISSDDNSQLWLSTSNDPAGKTLIASISGWTNPREWTKFSSQQSSPVFLTAGQKYYVEVLQKEGSGGDNLAVGWQGPGITGDTERPIPGSRLIPYETGLLREVWNDVQGTAVSDLTSDPDYPDAPSSSGIISSFEAPVDVAEYYGGRIRGYIVPPTSGNYTFWIASDDNSELWLSNNTSPSGKSLIASVPSWTSSREWTKFSSQQSSPVYLNAGEKYYVEVLYKEGYGGDNCAVGWQGPGITGDAERPIPGSRLRPWTGSTTPTYSLTIANDGHGTTSPSGTVDVDSGATTSISATPASGYEFAGWTVTGGTASITNPSSATTTVTLSDGDATIRADFYVLTYSLTMTNDGNGATSPSGTINVDHGTATAITATPDAGYQFVNWTVTSGTASITNPSSPVTSVILTGGNATIRANFTLQTYTLSMTNDGHGNTTPSGAVTVAHGAATPITATPSTGYAFAGWTVTSGTASIANPSSATTTVTLTSGNATVRANFSALSYTLTMANDGNGTTTPSGTVTVPHGTATPITATPATGYEFSGWSVTSGSATIANPSSAATTVTLTSGDATVQANFTVQSFTLTVGNDGNGTTTPSGAVSVNYGVATSIAATPATGYEFVNWTVTSGTATIANPSSATTTVTLTSGNATVQANFSAFTYTLTVGNDGNGTTTPSGAVTVTHGAATSIAATPSAGYQFLNWTVTSGSAAIANPSSAATTVTLTGGDAAIQANFATQTYTLTMTNDGNGTTTPSGTITVEHGVATTIAATPASGYQFVNWTITSGTASIAAPSSATTTVTLSSGNATLQANFSQQMDVLTISNNGNGTTVPAGDIDVGRGVPTTISATANSGYHFVTWTVVSGTPAIDNPAAAATTVITSGDAEIRADFEANQPSLPNNRQIAITGELFDEYGNPVGNPTPETIEMQVQLWDQANGGSSLYTESYLTANGQEITVDNGRFVLRLGSGATSGDLTGVLTANENLFAEITVLSDEPDVLSPRTPVNASPYAHSVPAATVRNTTLHGDIAPVNQNITAPVGTYYINDIDGTTWIKLNYGWRMMD